MRSSYDMQNSRLNSPVALVTGGSQGIGAASVRHFLDRGWRVATVALPGENLERWRRSSVLAIEGDLTNPELRQAVLDETLARFGRIDALINNAGVGLYETPSNLSPELLRQLFEVNVIAPLALTQLVLPTMRRQRAGVIVNIGSVAGDVSMPWAVGYCASKFAMHALSDSLRRELHDEGIRVVRICPGIVATRFRENVLAGAVHSKLSDLRPVVLPEQVAAAIVRAAESPRLNTIYVPELGRLFAAMQNLCPPLMDWYLGRLAHKNTIYDANEQNFSPAIEPGVEH